MLIKILKQVFFLIFVFFEFGNAVFCQDFTKIYTDFKNEKDPDLRSFKASVLANYYVQVNEDSVQYFKKEMLKFIAEGKLSEAGLLHLETQESLVAGTSFTSIGKAKQARKIYLKYKKNTEAATLGILIGLIYCEQGDYVMSSDEYMIVYRALKLDLKKYPKSSKVKSNYTLLLDHLSYLYYTSGDHVQALKYDLENVKYCEKNGTKTELSVALSNAGTSYMQNKDLDNAIKTFERCADVRKNNVVPHMMGHSEFRLAGCYYSKKEFEKAYYYVNKAMILKAQYKNNFMNQALIHNLTGIILYELGRNDEALLECKKAYDTEMARINTAVQKEACECLSKVHAALGNKKLAYTFLIEYSDVSDSIFRREKSAHIGIKSKFISIENDKYQDSLADNEASKFQTLKYNEQKKTITQTTFGISVLGLILLGLLVTIWYLNRAKKQNTSAQLIVNNAINEKEVMLKEIHHRVKNNFQVISSLLNLQVNILTSPLQITTLREAQTRILSMALVHQKLYSDVASFSEINMQSYYKDLFSHYFDNDSNLRNFVKVNIETNNLLLDLDRAIPLGLLSNEVFTNAIKYGKSENGLVEVSVVMSQENNEISIHFSDNGIGYDTLIKDELNEKIGLDLIDILADQLEAELDIYSDSGTHVLLKFKK